VLKSLGSSVGQLGQRLGHPDQYAGFPGASGSAGSDSVLHQRALARGQAQRAERRRQYRTIALLAAVFFSMVGVFSIIFHRIMEFEGQAHSWLTSVYWALTTMSTLGYGDITFESDAGRFFSIVVLLSGSIYLLVMLPFVFIQFVFMPWMTQRELRRAPRSVPQSMRGHLVLTALGPIEASLIERCIQAHVPYVLVVDDIDETMRLHDDGYRVVLGDYDDPQTYRNVRVDQAALVVATRNDRTNTNIAFTVREIAPAARIIASANTEASIDILEIAGADEVVQLGRILGDAMAARTLGPDGRSHVIGEFAGLKIAEANVARTDLAGKTLQELQLRARLGVGIIGVWERGRFEIATGQTRLSEQSVLLLAATPEQLSAYDEACSLTAPQMQHTVIIGGGRVGRSIARAFAAEGLSCTIIEQLPERMRPEFTYVIGDAADRAVLIEAGIEQAGVAQITTHDDDVNVYLTRYLRGLRPDMRIVSRSRLDRNVSTLYRAGADAVLSYAGTGSAVIWNQLRGEETLLVAQGLNVFRIPVPRQLVGSTLAEAHLHQRTSCNVVAVEYDGKIVGNPDAHLPLPADAELVLVGTSEAEARFCDIYGRSQPKMRSGPMIGQTVGR
jgi:Trk K+ transport system NAD-binding subunit